MWRLGRLDPLPCCYLPNRSDGAAVPGGPHQVPGGGHPAEQVCEGQAVGEHQARSQAAGQDRHVSEQCDLPVSQSPGVRAPPQV